jgi:hypothetical protein
MIELELKNFNEIKKSLRTMNEVGIAETNRAIHASIAIVQGQSIRNAPVYTGLMRARHTASFHDLFGSLKVNTQYAGFVHGGTRPHFPPIAPLEKWARRKLGVTAKRARAVAFLIQRKIGRKGTKAVPFLQEAIDQSQSKIDQYFDRAMEATIKKI